MERIEFKRCAIKSFLRDFGKPLTKADSEFVSGIIGWNEGINEMTERLILEGLKPFSAY
jgi:hypothetical protein